MPVASQQSVQAVTAGTGFVAKALRAAPFAQSRPQLDQNLETVLEHPNLALTTAATLGNRDANRRLVHIQTDNRHK